MMRKVPKEFVAALAIAAGVTAWKGRVSVNAYPVSDFLFIAGIALLIMGAAGVVRSSGVFDSTRYSVRLFVDLLLGRPKCPDSSASFADFRESLRGRKDVRFPIAGALVCLLASLAAAAASM